MTNSIIMKRKFVLLVILTLTLSKVFSQELHSEELKRFYHKDYNSFSDYLQRNVYFPPEAFNCTGVLLAGLTLSPQGDIVNVFSLNSLTSAIDDQILDLFESTSEYWKAKPIGEQSIKNSIVVIPIIFRLKNTEPVINEDNIKLKLEEPIEFTAMAGQEQMSASGYIKTEKLFKTVNKLVLKGKYERAEEIVNELLRRDPLNTEYYSKLIEIEIKIGNTEDACKNIQFVKTYLIKQPEEIGINCN